MPVTDPKTVKNRVHIDLTSNAADREQEIDRLLAHGARHVDIGQTGAESWTVLADPEGKRVLRGAPERNACPFRLLLLARLALADIGASFPVGLTGQSAEAAPDARSAGNHFGKQARRG